MENKDHDDDDVVNNYSLIADSVSNTLEESTISAN